MRGSNSPSTPDAARILCALVQVSDPTSLTATFVKKRCIGLPPAVHLCSVDCCVGGKIAAWNLARPSDRPRELKIDHVEGSSAQCQCRAVGRSSCPKVIGPR